MKERIWALADWIWFADTNVRGWQNETEPKLYPKNYSKFVRESVVLDEIEALQKELELVKAENSEMRFELDAKQRPLGEQVLKLTIENDKLRAALESIRYGSNCPMCFSKEKANHTLVTL